MVEARIAGEKVGVGSKTHSFSMDEINSFTMLLAFEERPVAVKLFADSMNGKGFLFS